MTRAVEGAGPSPEGAITKLVMADLFHEAAAIAAGIAGPEWLCGGPGCLCQLHQPHPSGLVNRWGHVRDKADADRGAASGPADGTRFSPNPDLHHPSTSRERTHVSETSVTEVLERFPSDFIDRDDFAMFEGFLQKSSSSTVAGLRAILPAPVAVVSELLVGRRGADRGQRTRLVHTFVILHTGALGVSRGRLHEGPPAPGRRSSRSRRDSESRGPWSTAPTRTFRSVCRSR